MSTSKSCQVQLLRLKISCLPPSWLPAQTQTRDWVNSSQTSKHTQTCAHNNMQPFHVHRWQNALRKCQTAEYWGGRERKREQRAGKSPVSGCRAGKNREHCWEHTHTPWQSVWCKNGRLAAVYSAHISGRTQCLRHCGETGAQTSCQREERESELWGTRGIIDRWKEMKEFDL